MLLTVRAAALLPGADSEDSAAPPFGLISRSSGRSLQQEIAEGRRRLAQPLRDTKG